MQVIAQFYGEKSEESIKVNFHCRDFIEIIWLELNINL